LGVRRTGAGKVSEVQGMAVVVREVGIMTGNVRSVAFQIDFVSLEKLYSRQGTNSGMVEAFPTGVGNGGGFLTVRRFFFHRKRTDMRYGNDLFYQNRQTGPVRQTARANRRVLQQKEHQPKTGWIFFATGEAKSSPITQTGDLGKKTSWVRAPVENYSVGG